MLPVTPETAHFEIKDLISVWKIILFSNSKCQFCTKTKKILIDKCGIKTMKIIEINEF